MRGVHLIRCCHTAGVSVSLFEYRDGVSVCLAYFYLANRDAPAIAGLLHVKRKLRCDLFAADEDERRVKLALGLYRMAVLGLYDIDREDGEAEVRRMQAAAPPLRREVDPEDMAFRRDDGRFERSALGRSVDRHHRRTTD